MIVVGADPGSARTGYAVLEGSGDSIKLLTSGVLKPSKHFRVEKRLSFIYQEFIKAMQSFPVDAIVIEGVFYGKNFRSALRLGEVRGVIMLAAGELGVPVFEYSPAEVKSSIVGHGSATKEQVRYMVAQILGLSPEVSFDESDAMAVALCHMFLVGGVLC